MKKVFLSILFLSLTLMATKVSVFAQKDEFKRLFTEKKLPDVTVTNLDGEKVNIADFGKNGKITIFNFWATWCAPCKKELANLHNLYEDWQNAYDLEIVAVSIDDSRNISNVKSYASGQAWDFIVLLDANQDLKRALNFQTVPYTIMVDEEGTIVYTHNSYVPGDEYILEDKIKELKGL